MEDRRAASSGNGGMLWRGGLLRPMAPCGNATAAAAAAAACALDVVPLMQSSQRCCGPRAVTRIWQRPTPHTTQDWPSAKSDSSAQGHMSERGPIAYLATQLAHALDTPRPLPVNAAQRVRADTPSRTPRCCCGRIRHNKTFPWGQRRRGRSAAPGVWHLRRQKRHRLHPPRSTLTAPQKQSRKQCCQHQFRGHACVVPT